MTAPFTVCIPAYNEEATIERVIRCSLAERRCTEIIIADDRSTDCTAKIVRALAASEGHIRLDIAQCRSGQLHGWLRGARSAQNNVVVFVDADSAPARGALSELADAVCGKTVIASGRVEPIRSVQWGAGYFSARLLHRIRQRPGALEAVIGRFFAVDRSWFLRAVTREDMLANDAFLAALAYVGGQGVRYVETASVSYHPPHSVADFVAQRLRASDGRRQLRELGYDAAKKEIPAWLLSVVIKEAMVSPIDAALWLTTQTIALVRRDFAAHRGVHSGIWETQASTKREL